MALDAAIHSSTGAFVLDLDASSSSTPAAWARSCAPARCWAASERQLAIVCRPGPVRRLFDVAGVADLLNLFASRGEAAAALCHPKARLPGVPALSLAVQLYTLRARLADDLEGPSGRSPRRARARSSWPACTGATARPCAARSTPPA